MKRRTKALATGTALLVAAAAANRNGTRQKRRRKNDRLSGLKEIPDRARNLAKDSGKNMKEMTKSLPSLPGMKRKTKGRLEKLPKIVEGIGILAGAATAGARVLSQIRGPDGAPSPRSAAGARRSSTGVGTPRARSSSGRQKTSASRASSQSSKRASLPRGRVKTSASSSRAPKRKTSASSGGAPKKKTSSRSKTKSTRARN